MVYLENSLVVLERKVELSHDLAGALIWMYPKELKTETQSLAHQCL